MFLRHRLLIPVVFSALLAGCGAPPESAEEQVRAWLDRGQTAVESKDRGALMEMISEHYSDRQGNDRAAVNNLLRAIFFRQQSIKLLTGIESLEIFDDSAAEVALTVGMAGTNQSRFGFSADRKRFVLQLERNGNAWELVTASWRDL